MNNIKPTVSIIVPVYNSEKTITVCLESIRTQTYKDIQVIVVNDGSTDNSYNICNEFAKKDSRFVIVDKQNSGVASSRNTALGLVEGKYVQFVDSDDYLANNATEVLVKAAEYSDSEMIVTSFYRVVNKNTYIKGNITKSEIMTIKKYAKYMMRAPANFYYGVCWNKLYKTSVIQENHVAFDNAISWGEDLLFNLNYLGFVKTVTVINYPIYYYIKTKGSLSSSKVMSKTATVIKKKLFTAYKNLYINLGLYEDNKLRIQKYRFSVAKDGGRYNEVSLRKYKSRV